MRPAAAGRVSSHSVPSRSRTQAVAVPPRSAHPAADRLRRRRADPRPPPASSRPGGMPGPVVAHRDHPPVRRGPRAAPTPAASRPTWCRDVVRQADTTATISPATAAGEHDGRPGRGDVHPGASAARTSSSRRGRRSPVRRRRSTRVLLHGSAPQRAPPARRRAGRARRPSGPSSGAAPLHQGEHLQHAVVDGAGQPGAARPRPRRHARPRSRWSPIAAASPTMKPTIGPPTRSRKMLP